jgi:hypothetical protein
VEGIYLRYFVSTYVNISMYLTAQLLYVNNALNVALLSRFLLWIRAISMRSFVIAG